MSKAGKYSGIDTKGSEGATGFEDTLNDVAPTSRVEAWEVLLVLVVLGDKAE